MLASWLLLMSTTKDNPFFYSYSYWSRYKQRDTIISCDPTKIEWFLFFFCQSVTQIRFPPICIFMDGWIGKIAADESILIDLTSWPNALAVSGIAAGPKTSSRNTNSKRLPIRWFAELLLLGTKSLCSSLFYGFYSFFLHFSIASPRRIMRGYLQTGSKILRYSFPEDLSPAAVKKKKKKNLGLRLSEIERNWAQSRELVIIAELRTHNRERESSASRIENCLYLISDIESWLIDACQSP